MSELARKLIAENKKTQATYLDLGNCGLTALPRELGELVWLEGLILSEAWVMWEYDGYQHHGTKNEGGSNKALNDITLLKKVSRLQILVANTTQITDLAPLLHLIQLGRKVSIEQSGGDITVYNCPLTSPPIEIVAQGNEAILNYFRERDAGDIDHLYEAKMLILGEGGAGKTSLLRRLYQPGLPLPEEQDTTKGIDIHRHDFTLANGRDFRLNVWDFGGGRRFTTPPTSFFSPAARCMCCLTIPAAATRRFPT